ncbi:hypothetical protein HDU96_002864 [Phlyctochytrium bullatum]|nr:hypothetical protein HDU96_002864 [Phlyctochytrium bullatum]
MPYFAGLLLGLLLILFLHLLTSLHTSLRTRTLTLRPLPLGLLEVTLLTSLLHLDGVTDDTLPRRMVALAWLGAVALYMLVLKRFEGEREAGQPGYMMAFL